MNLTFSILPRLFLEFILDFLYFPLWWYTGGAKMALLFCARLLGDANAFLAPGLWLKNIFVPMYGQYDWQGRLMSVFMRFVNFVGRSLGLFIWLLVLVGLFFIWLTIPVVVFSQLIVSFFR